MPVTLVLRSDFGYPATLILVVNGALMRVDLPVTGGVLNYWTVPLPAENLRVGRNTLGFEIRDHQALAIYHVWLVTAKADSKSGDDPKR